MSRDRIDVIGLLLGQPLWFLGVYVAMTALAPAMASWHALGPRIALATLAVGAVFVDWFRMVKGMESVGYLNLAIVWLFAQQLGLLMPMGTSRGCPAARCGSSSQARSRHWRC